jgi:hypothetical protein
VFAVKCSSVALRLVFEGRVVAWRERSGMAVVSKVA